MPAGNTRLGWGRGGEESIGSRQLLTTTGFFFWCHPEGWEGDRGGLAAIPDLVTQEINRKSDTVASL